MIPPNVVDAALANFKARVKEMIHSDMPVSTNIGRRERTMAMLVFIPEKMVDEFNAWMNERCDFQIVSGMKFIPPPEAN